MIILVYCKHDKKKTWEKNLYQKSARYGNMIGNKQFVFKFNLLMQIAYHILYIFQSVFNMYLQPPRKVALIVCLSLQKGVAPYIHWCKLIPQFLVALKVWINEIERWHQIPKELPLFQVHARGCTNDMVYSKATLKRKQPEMFKNN